MALTFALTALDEREQADPYALCVFVPLIDLDQDVGFTQFWPGSHRYNGLWGFGGAATSLGLVGSFCRCPYCFAGA